MFVQRPVAVFADRAFRDDICRVYWDRFQPYSRYRLVSGLSYADDRCRAVAQSPKGYVSSSPTEIGAKIAALPTPQQVANTVGSIASTNYAVLLPTADIATSMVTSLPAYNAALFTQQLAQGNLVNAIGLPIAADVGLATVAGAVEFLVLTEAVVNTLKDIQSLIP